MFSCGANSQSTNGDAMVTCSVSNCLQPAAVRVILYDVRHNGEVYFQKDESCPTLCTRHMLRNEISANGVRIPGGTVVYKYSNKRGEKGFTIYQPFGSSEPATLARCLSVRAKSVPGLTDGKAFAGQN